MATLHYDTVGDLSQTQHALVDVNLQKPLFVKVFFVTILLLLGDYFIYSFSATVKLVIRIAFWKWLILLLLFHHIIIYRFD
jgi:hypothetical protein